MSSKSLASLHVLVTRPAPQQEPLVAAIEAAAGHVLHRPLLEIRPLPEGPGAATLKSRILELDRYQILIFVSLNAVHYGVARIEDLWPQFPTGIQLAAIGPTTAASLESLLQVPVLQASAGVTSEDLLSLPELTAVSDKRIGIVRGHGGRELLADTLRQRGAEVDYLEVYERHLVSYPGAEFYAELQEHRINVLTVSSGESLAQLVAILGDNKAEMTLVPLLVPSGRVAQQAMDYGFRRVIDTGGVDVESTLAALEMLVPQGPGCGAATTDRP